LPETIGELKNLSSLDLNLRWNGLERLPETIGELKNLSSLDLSENKLERLPESIRELKNLSSLDLSWNKLERLPESIKKLALTLKKLDLRANPVLNNQKEMKKIKSWLPNTAIIKRW
jgi:Leucine-rich repeat (LRR) protein